MEKGIQGACDVLNVSAHLHHITCRERVTDRERDREIPAQTLISLSQYLKLSLKISVVRVRCVCMRPFIPRRFTTDRHNCVCGCRTTTFRMSKRSFKFLYRTSRMPSLSVLERQRLFSRYVHPHACRMPYGMRIKACG